jgi:hypothetical protein
MLSITALSLSLLLGAPSALPPTILPGSGSYTSSQIVTVGPKSAGTTLRCTTNGADPTTSSARYFTPFTISASATVKCRAWVSGKLPSSITSVTYVINTATGTPAALYAAAQTLCASMPIRATGTKYYFCECQTGAEVGCVAGNDANAGTNAAAPKRSWSALVSAFNSMPAGSTVSMCKGGAWTSLGTGSFHNTSCTATADPKVAANTTTCDIRDYQASWGGTARPILSAATDAVMFAFTNSAHDEGVRILNLDLRGNGPPPTGTSAPTQVGQWAFWTYGPHTDYFVCNSRFDGWNIAWDIQENNNGYPQRNIFYGNYVSNSGIMAQLGGSEGGVYDANYFYNNGSTNNRDHTLYLANDGTANVFSSSVINNEIRYSDSFSCRGVVLVVHGRYNNVLIENNIIDGGLLSGPGCWGVSLGNGGYTNAGWYSNTTIRRNTIMRGGNLLVALEQAPDSVVESNILIANQYSRGVVVPYSAARTGLPGTPSSEPITTRVQIKNNTLYLPTPGSDGIMVGPVNEGTGYVIANNSIYFTGSGNTCFSTPLSAGQYEFVGNNACYNGTWGTTYDATTHITANPLFTNPPTDFTPQAGSPLIAAGSSTYKSATDFNGATWPTPPSIGAVGRSASVASCLTEPLRSTGTVYYVCDCQSGADPDCIAGSDSANGTSKSTPWQSFAKAMTTFKSMGAGNTVALCKGGSWQNVTGSNVAGSGHSSNSPATILNANCSASSTCDFRDYDPSPVFAATAKPIIKLASGYDLFGFGASRFNSAGYTRTPVRGFRILNLDMVGPGSAGDAVLVYGKTEDLEVCGNTMRDGFGGAYSASTTSTVKRVNFHHNRITNNPIGVGVISGTSCFSDCTFDSNYLDLNGGFDSGGRDHSIYVGGSADPQGFTLDGTQPEQLCYSSSACYIRSQRIRITNNEVYRSAHGPTGNQCSGSTIVVHEPHDDLVIENNLIYEAPGTAAGGCFGLDLSSGRDAPASFRRAIIRRNQIYNTGNDGIAVSECIDCLIDSNLVVGTSDAGITFPVERYTAATGSEASARTLVRNNTVYNGIITVNTNVGSGGVTEGTGHIVANNVACGTGSQVAIGTGATGYSNRSGGSCTGLFTSAGTNPAAANFTPAAASALIGVGNATYAVPAIGTVPWSATDTGKARDASPDVGAYER